MDQAADLDHQFRIAAYVVTWVIPTGLSHLARTALAGAKGPMPPPDPQPTLNPPLLHTPATGLAAGRRHSPPARAGPVAFFGRGERRALQ